MLLMPGYSPAQPLQGLPAGAVSQPNGEQAAAPKSDELVSDEHTVQATAVDLANATDLASSATPHRDFSGQLDRIRALDQQLDGGLFKKLRRASILSQRHMIVTQMQVDAAVLRARTAALDASSVDDGWLSRLRPQKDPRRERAFGAAVTRNR